MYGMDPEHERASGWIDGIRAAGVSLRNTVRLELERFGFESPAIGRGSAPRAAHREAESPIEPDNPLGDPDYEEGFERGFAEGLRAVARKLRGALAAQDLYLTDEGHLVTTDLVDALVRWHRDHASPLPETPLDDATIIDFIDTAIDAAIPPVGIPDPVAVPTTVDSAPTVSASFDERSPIQRTWTMVKQNIDRRTAVACLIGLLGGASGLGVFSGRSPNGSVEAQSSSTSLGIPAAWGQIPPAERDVLISIHSMVTSLDASWPAGVPLMIQQAITAPAGVDPYKALVVKYVRELTRGDLLPALMSGLTPSNPVQLRRGILGAIEAIRTSAPQTLPTSVGQQLKAYARSGIETDPRTQGLAETFAQRL